ncbi:MAG: hypothetical protein AB7P03_19785 [Kofleriaceae bacterium]
MRSILLILVGVALAACSDDGGDNNDGNLNVCTMALYDSCSDNEDCVSGNCHEFESAGITVCTQACNMTDNPCPESNGITATCNMNMMICKPASEHACMPQ